MIVNQLRSLSPLVRIGMVSNSLNVLSLVLFVKQASQVEDVSLRLTRRR
jgi:hypothetical protein